MLEILLGTAPLTKSPVGQRLFTNTTGADVSTDWVVPAGVYFISVVAVGSGGGSPTSSSSGASRGGNGGNLRWRNQIPVTPGETLTVTVGRAGNFGGSGAVYGRPASLSRQGTILLLAGGGGYTDANETPLTSPNCGGGNGGVGYNAVGQYGGGGGGAGGYSGNGGNASNFTGKGLAGTGGGGGGGAGYLYNDQYYGSSGGSVGLNGQGGNGAGGTGGGYNAGNFGSGYPGSGGQSGTGVTAGAYGAGSASHGTVRPRYAVGGQAGLRIIWGNGRAFPNTFTADQ